MYFTFKSYLFCYMVQWLKMTTTTDFYRVGDFDLDCHFFFMELTPSPWYQYGILYQVLSLSWIHMRGIKSVGITTFE
jgi:hypothetical protein